MKIKGCCALITGASAGLGREFARQLAGHAGSMVLVARREERLHELRDELTRRDPNLNVHIRRIDLANPAEVDELMAWLEREKIEVDLLINNAGVGDFGPFATIDPASGGVEVVAPVESDEPTNRMNDGKVDPGGRFWAGTMGVDHRAGAGTLYRLDPDLRVTPMLPDVSISNGLDWSPDGTKLVTDALV